MHLHAIVSGDVQGVGFRAHTSRIARSLGITGWVRNREDGSVEVVAEGAKTVLQELLAWLQHGPSTAEVEKVDSKMADYEEGFHDFTVAF